MTDHDNLARRGGTDPSFMSYKYVESVANIIDHEITVSYNTCFIVCGSFVCKYQKLVNT